MEAVLVILLITAVEGDINSPSAQISYEYMNTYLDYTMEECFQEAYEMNSTTYLQVGNTTAVCLPRFHQPSHE